MAPSLPAVRDALRALLSESSAAIDSPYAVTEVVFGATVEATLEADGLSFVLQIAPATVSRYYRRTDLFNISYRGKSLDRSAYAVVDAACAAIAAWERSLPAGAEALLFTAPTPSQDGSRLELLAVGRVVKPTCRIVVPPQAGEEVVAAARRLGLHARRADARRYSGSAEDLAHLQRTRATSLVLVARTAGELEALADSERREAGQAEIGALLGYPRCCIDAFIAHDEDPKSDLRYAAMQRTGATGSYLLNDLDGKAGLVSHLVCRYDCAPSIEIAGAVLNELAREAPAEAEAFAATLRGLMIAFKDGGTLRLEVGPVATPLRYSFTAIHPVGDGPSIWSWRAALVGADALEVQDKWVRVLAGQHQQQRLEASEERVQIRLFA
jgi:hypothetical protein